MGQDPKGSKGRLDLSPRLKPRKNQKLTERNQRNQKKPKENQKKHYNSLKKQKINPFGKFWLGGGLAQQIAKRVDFSFFQRIIMFVFVFFGSFGSVRWVFGFCEV